MSGFFHSAYCFWDSFMLLHISVVFPFQCWVVFYWINIPHFIYPLSWWCVFCFHLVVIVQSLSRVWLFLTPWTVALQASLSITNSWSLLQLMSIELLMPSIQPSHPVVSFSSYLQSFPASGAFLMSQLFTSGGESIAASASASVRLMNIQDWLVWSLCSPKDSQVASPTPQFKNINTLMLSFLYSPTLTSIHDYWENHSFD